MHVTPYKGLIRYFQRYIIKHANDTTTRRKECHMQPFKEWLSVLYNSYMTKQLKNWMNIEVYPGVVVFQLYYRLGDVVVEKEDQ